MAGKDAAEVDNTYFLLPVKILDHEGPLGTSFPIENRHLPQGDGPLMPGSVTCWVVHPASMVMCMSIGAGTKGGSFCKPAYSMQQVAGSPCAHAHCT